jgi:hypothetical protein
MTILSDQFCLTKECPVSEHQSDDETKTWFNPQAVIGTFWTAFGAIVLLASFFVTDSEYVPQTRGILSNAIAGLLLLGTGLLLLIRGRDRT